MFSKRISNSILRNTRRRFSTSQRNSEGFWENVKSHWKNDPAFRLFWDISLATWTYFIAKGVRNRLENEHQEN